MEANEMVIATMEVSTNWLFKKMLTANFKKSHNQFDKNQFLKIINVDVEIVEPVYFNDQTYNKSTHENCFFIFLDSQLNIMGILKGNKHLKEHESSFEKWDSPKSWNSKYTNVISKNRKNLTEKCTHILMITPEMLTRKIKPVSRYGRRECDHRRELHHRLREYKLQKNSVFTYEQIMTMTKQMMEHLTSKMFNHEAALEIAKKTKHINWNYGPKEIYRVISDVAEAADKYYEYYLKAEEYRRSDSPHKDYYVESSTNDAEQYKLKLVDFYKAIMGA